MILWHTREKRAHKDLQYPELCVLLYVKAVETGRFLMFRTYPCSVYPHHLEHNNENEMQS